MELPSRLRVEQVLPITADLLRDESHAGCVRKNLLRIHDVVIRDQIDGDRHSVSPVRLDGGRASGRIPAVVEHADVSEHGQELLARGQAVVVGKNIREPFPLGFSRCRTARC